MRFLRGIICVGNMILDGGVLFGLWGCFGGFDFCVDVLFVWEFVFGGHVMFVGGFFGFGKCSLGGGGFYFFCC